MALSEFYDTKGFQKIAHYCSYNIVDTNLKAILFTRHKSCFLAILPEIGKAKFIKLLR